VAAARGAGGAGGDNGTSSSSSSSGGSAATTTTTAAEATKAAAAIAAGAAARAAAAAAAAAPTPDCDDSSSNGPDGCIPHAPAPPPPPSLLARLLTPSPHDAAIAGLALPAVIALAADPLLGVVDAALVGRGLGSDALGALGVNTSVFALSFLVWNFLGTATAPLVATAAAAGDADSAGEAVWAATAAAAVLGAGTTAALTLGADPVLRAMGCDAAQHPAMFDLARSYLLVRASAAPAVLVATVGQGAFRGAGNMRTPLAVTLATNALHLALTAGLVFGPPRMGIAGAALSTAVSEWAAAGAYVALARAQLQGSVRLWPPPAAVARRLRWLAGAGAASAAADGGGAAATAAAAAAAAAAAPARRAEVPAEAGGRALVPPPQQHQQQQQDQQHKREREHEAAAAAAARAVLRTAAGGETTAAAGAPAGDSPSSPPPEPSSATTARFFEAGGAVLLRTGFLLGTKTLATAAAARLGPSAAGAHLILTQLWSLASMALDALAVAGQTLVAVELGRGDRRAARAVGDRLLQLGAAGGVVLTAAAALALSSSVWPRAFSDDRDTLAAVGALWPLAVAPLPMNAVIYTLDGVLVGAGDFKFLCLAMALAAAAAATTLAATEGSLFGLGAAGSGQDAVQALAAVWTALAVLMGGRAATLMWRYWLSPGSPLAVGAAAAGAAAASASGEVRPQSRGRGE